MLVPTTGGLAANGKDMINGLQLYLEEQGSKLAGREIKLIIEDDEGKPATGLTKARGLVEEQAVQLLTGPLSAAVGYAVAPYIDGKKVPTIFPIVSAEDITQRKRSPYIVRTGWSSAQPSHPFGKWVYDNLGYKKIAMIGYDFAFGWEVAGGFQRTFEDAGGQVVQKLWPPLGTADFGPYLAQLRRDVDAIYAVFSGADALRFAKQFSDTGLKARLPLIGGGTFTDEHVLRTMGDEALGIVTALHYSAALATPANKKFVQAYEAKFKQVPSYYSEGSYVAGVALKAALEATGGDIENADKFLGALRKVDLSDAPRGPVRFDDFGNPIQNIYVRKVEKVGGRLQNTVIHTFPAVSQFGPYKAEDFLKNPVYSRDWPPCKAC
jgi:branched-chain amino acid transport system substrate-binding protein